MISETLKKELFEIYKHNKANLLDENRIRRSIERKEEGICELNKEIAELNNIIDVSKDVVLELDALYPFLKDMYGEYEAQFSNR